MAKLLLSDARKIKHSLKDYNNSPWRHYGSSFKLKRLLEIASLEGTSESLSMIRRADITAYHKEEGACGNI